MITSAGRVNDWNGMLEEIELKRETLELWRRGKEKGREEIVVDMAIGYNTKTSRD